METSNHSTTVNRTPLCPSRGFLAVGATAAVRAFADAYRYRRAPLREDAQRAARLSWARRLSTIPTVQAVATSFLRLAPAASSSSLTVFDPMASKIGCARSRTSPGPEASTTSRPRLAVSLTPITGQSTNVIPWSSASPAGLSLV
jgi:hypothetical protein